MMLLQLLFIVLGIAQNAWAQRPISEELVPAPTDPTVIRTNYSVVFHPTNGPEAMTVNQFVWLCIASAQGVNIGDYKLGSPGQYYFRATTYGDGSGKISGVHPQPISVTVHSDSGAIGAGPLRTDGGRHGYYVISDLDRWNNCVKGRPL